MDIWGETNAERRNYKQLKQLICWLLINRSDSFSAVAKHKTRLEDRWKGNLAKDYNLHSYQLHYLRPQMLA